MSEQRNSGEFLQHVRSVKEKTEKLHQLTQQTLEVMRQQGFRIKLNLDVDSLVREADQDLRQLQKEGLNLEQQLDQYQELVRTSALINSSLDLDKVLEEVMDTVIHLTSAERGYLMLTRTDKQDEFIIRAARNWDRETLHNDAVTFSRGIIQQAIEGGQPIVTTNAQMDERFQNMASVMTHDLRSVIVIPLILHGNVLGVLYVDNRMGQTIFRQSALPLLTAFANQAAIAIQNARYMEKVKDDLAEAKREVARLRIQIDQGRVSREVSSITDSDYFQRLSDIAKDMRKRGPDESDEKTE